MTNGLPHRIEKPRCSDPRVSHKVVPNVNTDMDLCRAVPQQCFLHITRLRKRFEFVSVQRRGVRCCTGSLVFIAKKRRNHTQGRVGFTAPKKIGPAHVRNRVKRRLRHLTSYYQQAFVGYDIVILALPRAADHSFGQLHKDFQLGKQGLQRKIKRGKP